MSVEHKSHIERTGIFCVTQKVKYKFENNNSVVLICLSEKLLRCATATAGHEIGSGGR